MTPQQETHRLLAQTIVREAPYIGGVRSDQPSYPDWDAVEQCIVVALDTVRNDERTLWREIIERTMGIIPDPRWDATRTLLQAILDSEPRAE